MVAARRRVTPSSDLVLPSTAPREQWLAARRSGITATDIVKIVGLSRYGNAIDVYLAKRLDWPDETPGEAAEWGTLLEDQVAREWARRHGVSVRRVGLVRRAATPHHLATCDRLIVGGRAPLEVKTRTAWQVDEWDDGQGGTSIPERVAVQCHWQAHVLGVDRVHVAALVGGQRLFTGVVERDDAIVDYLRQAADRTWAAVEAGIPPELPAWQLTAASLDRLHPDRAGAIDVDPDQAGPLLADYRAAMAAEKTATAAKEQAKLQLIALLGDAEAATVDGQPAYTYRASVTSTSIPAQQARALLAAHPDLAAEYAVTRPGRRSFALAKKEKSS